MNYSSVRIQNGDKEPVITTIIDSSGDPLINKTDIKLKVWRSSDGKFFDWDDDTFKDAGSVTEILTAMNEVDSINAKGEYQLNKPRHIRGFDTSEITNPINGFDVYQFIIVQDGGTDANNVPQYGEIHVGGFTDNLDEKISVIKTDVELIKDGGGADFDPLTDSLHDISDKFAAIETNQTNYYNLIDTDLELIKDGNTGTFNPSTDPLSVQADAIAANQLDLELIKDGNHGNFDPLKDSLHDQTIHSETNNTELQNIKDGNTGTWTVDHSLKALDEELQAIKGSGFVPSEDNLHEIEGKFAAIETELELIKSGGDGDFNPAADSLHDQSLRGDNINNRIGLVLDGNNGDFSATEDSLHDLRAQFELLKHGGDNDWNPSTDSLHDRTIADNEIKNAVAANQTDLELIKDGGGLSSGGAFDPVDDSLSAQSERSQTIITNVEANQVDLELIKDGNTGTFDPLEDSLHNHTEDIAANQIDLELIKDGNTGTFVPAEDSLHSIKLYTKDVLPGIELIKDGNTGNFVPAEDNLHELHGDIESNQVDLELIKDGNTGTYAPTSDSLHHQRIANDARFDDIDVDLSNIGVDLEEIKGTGFDTGTDSLKEISDKTDANQVDLELIKAGDLSAGAFDDSADSLRHQRVLTDEIDSKVDRIMDGNTGDFVDAEDNLHVLSTDVGSIETNVTNIGDDLDEIKGVGFDTSNDSLKAISDKMPDLDILKRLLGLSHEDAFIDNTTFDPDNQMLTARMRIFDSKANAEAATDGGSETQGLIAVYQMQTVWHGVNRMKTFRMVLNP